MVDWKLPGLDTPHAYTGKRETSGLAALEILPVTGRQRLAVFEFIKSCGDYGATLEQIETGLSMSGNSVRPRRKELEDRGAVEEATLPSGEPLRRKNRAGRMTIVWRVSKPYLTKRQ
tara:strand:+ start:70 stop:420 length:351 start_codon:yes stop_codon:yes gene_type:complete